jgi:hypothetical protein
MVFLRGLGPELLLLRSGMENVRRDTTVRRKNMGIKRSCDFHGGDEHGRGDVGWCMEGGLVMDWQTVA